MAYKILIMGLPGSGKTTLAYKLIDELSSSYTILHLNGDNIRKVYNDWDFSIEGRLRQGNRMRHLANDSVADIVVCDFVAPLSCMRDSFDANVIIWLDTIERSRFADTDKVFEPPSNYDFVFTSHNSIYVEALCRHFTKQIQLNLALQRH